MSRVDGHFKRLAEFEWLRQVREETGGRRRGSTEHFFRAPRLAVFDNATWAQLPVSLREEFSWRIFEQFAERVKGAFEAGTFDSRRDRHFTWTPLILDEEGRGAALEAVDGFFLSLGDEEDDARRRMSRSGQRPIHTTIGLGAFDSPNQQRNLAGLGVESDDSDAQGHPVPFPSRLARVFSSQIALKIISELNLREMSRSQFAAEFGASPSLVYRRFQMLVDDGWLKKVDEKTGGRRRGATEHFYRAIGPAIFDTRNWSTAPEANRREGSWRIFEQLAEQVTEAMRARTLDSRPDRHLTWSPLLLDEQGWKQAIRKVDTLFYFLLAEQKAAKRRLQKSHQEPLVATAFLAAFESPVTREVANIEF